MSLAGNESSMAAPRDGVTVQRNAYRAFALGAVVDGLAEARHGRYLLRLAADDTEDCEIGWGCRGWMVEARLEDPATPAAGQLRLSVEASEGLPPFAVELRTIDGALITHAALPTSSVTVAPGTYQLMVRPVKKTEASLRPAFTGCARSVRVDPGGATIGILRAIAYPGGCDPEFEAHNAYVRAQSTIVVVFRGSEVPELFQVHLREQDGTEIGSWRASEESPPIEPGAYNIYLSGWLPPGQSPSPSDLFGGCTIDVQLEEGAGTALEVTMRPSHRDCAMTPIGNR